MGLFNRQPQAGQPQKNPLEAKFDAARTNLLLMLVFTVVNVVMVLVDANSYFLFTATFPWLMTITGAGFAAEGFPVLCGFCVALAGIAVVLYLLCWLLSKKHPAWLIVATVLFSLDTVMLLFFLSADMIIDVAFHAWVLYYLIAGIVAANKLKKQPAATEMPVAEMPAEPPVYAEPLQTPVPTEQPPVMMINGEPMDDSQL